MRWQVIRSRKPKHRSARFIINNNGNYIAKTYGHTGLSADTNARLICRLANAYFAQLADIATDTTDIRPGVTPNNYDNTYTYDSDHHSPGSRLPPCRDCTFGILGGEQFRIVGDDWVHVECPHRDLDPRQPLTPTTKRAYRLDSFEGALEEYNDD